MRDKSAGGRHDIDFADLNDAFSGLAEKRRHTATKSIDL